MAFLGRSFIERIGNLNFTTGMIAKRDVSDVDLSTCFWCNLTNRLILFVLTIFLAPVIASFFNNMRIVSVLRWLSLLFIITIPSFVPSLLLQRQLNFKPLSIINMLAVTIECLTAVICAYLFQARHWSLVMSVITGVCFIHIAIFLYNIWLPSLQFSKESFKYITRYGIAGLGANLANFIQGNVDYVITGRLLGAKFLGYYEYAYRIPHLLQERVATPVAEVLFPAFSEIQNNDTDLADAYLKVTRHMAFVVLPLLVVLITNTQHIVPLLWGQQWYVIIVPMKILCICSFFNIIFLPVDHLFTCKNKPGAPFKFGVIRAILSGALVYSFSSYGLIGVAWGMTIGALLSLLYAYLAFRMLSVSFKRFVSAIFPSLVAALFTTVLIAFLEREMIELSLSHIKSIFISGITSITCYFLIFIIFFKKSLDEMLQTAKRLIRFTSIIPFNI